MKRSPMVRKPKKRKPKSLKALRATKPQTRSRVSKGPARSPEHLALVRAEKCLGCFNTPSAHAHHVREMLPRTMGRRVSDYFTAPLCPFHHQDPFFGVHGLHGGMAFWDRIGVDPAKWIAQFLRRTYPEPRPEGVAEALAMVETQRTMDARTVLR